MSINIVNIHQAKSNSKELVSDVIYLQDIIDHSDDALVHAVTNCTLLILQNMVLKQAITFGETVDKIIIGRIAITAKEFIVDSLTLGRRGVRLITSAWTKEKCPEAKYELVLTLIDIDDNTPHVFLIYI